MIVDRLLLTRPQAQSLRFAEACRARFGPDLDVTISPKIGIRPKRFHLDLRESGGVILTSENAARILLDCETGPVVPVWCVGERTARLVKSAGWTVAGSSKDAQGLLALLRNVRPAGSLVHISGTHVTTDFQNELKASGIKASRMQVYDQVEVPLSVAAKEVLADETPLLVPVFSPRSASLLLPDLRAARAHLCIAAMSHAVAGELTVQSDAEIAVAATPDSLAMLDALASLRRD